MGRPLSILIVEDSPDDAELVVLALRRGGIDPTWERVETGQALQAALAARPWDAVLSDYSLPEFGAVAGLPVVRSYDPDLPFLVVSGTVGEDAAVAMMLAGADDYFLKHSLTRLVPALERRVRESGNRRAQRAAERQAQLLAAVVDSSEDAIVSSDLNGHIQSWNGAAERLFGYTAAEVMGQSGFLIPSHLVAEVRALDVRIRRGERVPSFESIRLRKGGQPVSVSISVSPVRVAGQVVSKSAIYRDITRQKETETRLREAQTTAEQHLARLRGVVGSMHEGLIVADHAGNMLDWNAAALAIHGFGSVEEVRQHLAWFANNFELTTPGGIKVPLEDWPLAKVLRGEKLAGWELQVKRLDTGREFMVSYSGAPVLGPQGEVVLAVLTIHDVTQRRRAERELRLFRTLIDQASDGFEVVDPATSRFVDVNEQTCLAHGYTREEFLNLHVADIDPFITTPSWDGLFEEGRFAKPHLFETTHRRKDGSTFPVEVSLDTIRLDRDYLVAVVRDISERKRAEKELAELLTRLNLQIERMPLAYLLSTTDMRYTRWNPAAERMFGFTEAEVLGKLPSETIVPPQSLAAVKDIFTRLAAGDMDAHGSCENVTKEGKTIVCEWHNTPLFGPDESFQGVLSLAQDVTAKRVLEEQVRQGQKMEAFGQLAGGVAHDFNNVLTVITGYSEMILSGMLPADKHLSFIRQIRAAGERAASLTRQLLAFSRKQVLQPVDLNLNSLVANIEKMLRRLIGEDIDLMAVLDPALGLVKADPGQMEQVIMNLVVNARDAMPTGGHLTIETSNVELDPAYVRTHAGAQAGAHVMLAVTDSGSGMTEATRARIFEPFFTTKEVGKGTGLGLATVHGIVKQSGGTIEVYSELGTGTAFKIYLPRIQGTLVASKSDSGLSPVPGGAETVLVAEDEDSVRALICVTLESNGYTVLAARNGEEALELCKRHTAPIDLLVTDVVMPKMSGRLLADNVLKMRPSIKVLYLSGYTDDAVVRHGVLEAAMAFLQKPLTPILLARKVREVLDAGKPK